jgi:hypothetical protein
MTFEEYLLTKKIDPKKFSGAEQERFEEWRCLFEQMHPKSFTEQKLYLINKIRRRYTFVDEPKPAGTKPNAKPKPVIKPSIKK